MTNPQRFTADDVLSDDEIDEAAGRVLHAELLAEAREWSETAVAVRLLADRERREAEADLFGRAVAGDEVAEAVIFDVVRDCQASSRRRL